MISKEEVIIHNLLFSYHRDTISEKWYVPLAVVSTRTQEVVGFGFWKGGCPVTGLFVFDDKDILRKIFFTIFLQHFDTTFG